MSDTNTAPQYSLEHCYNENFSYERIFSNPYDEKLESLFSHFVLRDNQGESYRGKWNTAFFKREDAPLHVEIGPGYGDFMLNYCPSNPEINFVAMDFRFKRSFTVAKKLSQLPAQNFCYLRARAERLEFLFAPGEIHKLFCFFPDPWPKARHHKKRLFNKRFFRSIHQCLKKGGEFHFKTDHAEYFPWILEQLDDFQKEGQEESFEVLLQTENLYETAHQSLELPFLASFQTKFEKIFLQKEIKIKAFVLRKK